MTFTLSNWLATLCRNVCAHVAGDAGFAERVLENEYKLLLTTGYYLLPNVAIDLAYLYQFGEGVHFKAPRDSSVSSGLLKYCECLNGIPVDGTVEGHLHRAIKRAHSLRALTSHKQQNNKDSLPGLLSFLQLTSGLFPSVGEPELWREVRQSWNDNVVKARHSSRANDAGADKLLKQFFERVTGGELRAANETEGIMTLAAARVPAGLEGLDLALLQACLDYLPSDLDYPGTKRLPVALISPRENRRSRSPESGIHGIDRKGSPTAILRSHLAREDFVERYYRNEILYFQRRAPKLEPRRILLGWIVERNSRMSARVSGLPLRRDTAALRLVASLLEDVVRQLAWVPVLDLRVIVILHNGEEDQQLQGAILEPKVDELRAAPRSESLKPQIWLPRLAAFMPYYFLRELEWPNRNPFKETPPDWGPAKRALRLLCRYAQLSRVDSSGDGGTVFDLAHVSLLGCADANKTTSKSDDELSQMLRLLNPISGLSSLHRFSFDEKQVQCVSLPAQPEREQRLESKYDYGTEHLLRKAYWNDLVNRLIRL